jgi:hypothetical protein
MGVVDNIAADQFPQQGDLVGRQAQVCFRYDTRRTFDAVIVRDDREAPWITILRLADGRHILASECQYAPDYPKEQP